MARNFAGAARVRPQDNFGVHPAATKQSIRAAKAATIVVVSMVVGLALHADLQAPRSDLWLNLLDVAVLRLLRS